MSDRTFVFHGNHRTTGASGSFYKIEGGEGFHAPEKEFPNVDPKDYTVYPADYLNRMATATPAAAVSTKAPGASAPHRTVTKLGRSKYRCAEAGAEVGKVNGKTKADHFIETGELT